MTTLDGPLHEANAAAHKVAREALKFRRDLKDTSASERRVADMRPLADALDRYEEAQRRAQMEATS